MRISKLLAAVVLVFGLTYSSRAHAALEVYHLYVIWLQGEGEGDQKNLDAFIDCLYHHSDYEAYWSGNVLIEEAGSYVVPKPTSALGDAGEIGPFIDGLIAAKKIPAPPSYGTPIYQVMVDPSQTSCSLGGGTGGRNAVGVAQKRSVGLILNTTNPNAFWPARTPLGGETSLTEHEVAEVIDGLRGGYQCAGDFCCEGWCNLEASCSNLYGLECPGAPATTFTGSSACGSVKGWLVQTLSHQGAKTCAGPVTCDFKLAESCSNDDDNLHAPCKADTDCCGGLTCQKWTYSGHSDDPPEDVCCKGVGATCSSGTDCCGGMNCDSTSHCACVAAGQFCANDGDCCSGNTCQNAVCAKPIVVDAGRSVPDASATPEPNGEAGIDGGIEPTSEQGGCSCDLASTSKNSSDGGFAALALAFTLSRRRWRKH